MRRVLCAVAVVVVATLGLSSGTASAGELKEVSWWWRGNTGPAPLPPTASVPPGGLLVAGAPDGATAISALRYVLADNESNPQLTLAVPDNGDQGGDQAVMAACLAGSAWGGSEQGGPWESKPSVACQTGSVQGVRSADGKTWTFALAPLVVGNEVNVVMTPGTLPGTPVGSTFSLTFSPPTSASWVTTPGAAPASSDIAAPAPTPDAVSDSSTATVGSDLGGATAAPAIGLSTPLPSATAFQPSLPASSQGLRATAPLVRERTARNVTPVEDGGRGSAAAVLVLLACVVIAIRLYRVPTPAPRLLGPLASTAARLAPTSAAPQPGGLGRFSRLRTGAPPPLV